MKIEWIAEYNLGIERIDEQHKWLIKLYNNIDNALNTKQSSDVLNTYIKGLLHYTRFHFNEEEHELKQVNYPKYTEHKEMHNKFILKVNDFLTDFNEGNTETVTEVLYFLKDWLLNHILREDKKYVPLIKGSNLENLASTGTIRQ